jgi:hypothetical protein
MSLGTAVVILAVYDFLVEMASGCGKQRRHFEPFVQSVVQLQVEQVVQKGLDKGVFQMGRCPSLAAALSWAIYGAAISALRSGDSKDGRAAIRRCAARSRQAPQIPSASPMTCMRCSCPC